MTFTVIGILFYWCPVKRNESINVDKNILLSDKNRIIPRSAIDKAEFSIVGVSGD